MKVGGYTLDLYCDKAEERIWLDPIHKGMDFPVQYYGPNKSYCYREARRQGWRLGEKDLCPKCSGKKK